MNMSQRFFEKTTSCLIVYKYEQENML